MTRTSPRDTAPGATTAESPKTVVRQALTRFLVAGVAALLLVSLAVWYAADRAAEREAIDDARQRTITLADAVVQPALTDALAAGDPSALTTFDRLVRERILSSEVVRVKVWDRDGRVVYSDEPRLRGAQYALDEEEVEVLEQDLPAVAEASDLERPENRFDAGHGPLLEVYLSVHTPGGEPLLFETYQTRSAVAARSREVVAAFAPVALGGLALLLIVLVPFAVSLARRLDHARAEREGLLEHALNASTTERRRIAAHLHDGMVQSLAGSSYALSAVADRLSASDEEWAAAPVRAAAGELRQGVRGLRSLLVEIYPPGLRRAGLASALSDLTAELSSREIDVVVDVDRAGRLSERVEDVLFRVAQESVRNIVKHADASHVRLTLERVDDAVVLTVADDGKGFALHDPERPSSATAKGHLGLPLLEDALAEVRGALTLTSSPGNGTVLTARIPLA